jgi:hypothetical protein
LQQWCITVRTVTLEAASDDGSFSVGESFLVVVFSNTASISDGIKGITLGLDSHPTLARVLQWMYR